MSRKKTVWQIKVVFESMLKCSYFMHICIKKLHALQNARRNNFAQCSASQFFSEFVGENPLTADAFSNKVFRQE